MENKRYYKPELKELCIGFKCEYLHDHYSGSAVPKNEWRDIWKEIIFDRQKIVEWLMYEPIHPLRIKYIDKDDIEKLGWKYKDDRGMSENYGYLFQIPQKEFEQGYYKLRFWYNSNRICIDAMQGKIFDGTIKNKSELIKVMEMLGIKKN